MQRRFRAAALLAAVSFAPALSAQTLPRKAPDFAITLSSGRQLQLSQYKGKVVAVFFLLTYCSLCQTTLATLSKAQTDYGSRGFQVLASAIEDMAPTAIPDFVRRYKPPFPVGFNNRAPALEFVEHSTDTRLLMPQLVFVDRMGMIRAQYGGDDSFLAAGQERNVRGLIEELLEEPSPLGRRGAAGAAIHKKLPAFPRLD